MLTPPLANFELELKRLNIPAPPFKAFHFTNDPVAETAQADLSDLLDALGKLPSPSADLGNILRGYAAETAKLAKYRAVVDQWSYSGRWEPVTAEVSREVFDHPRPAIVDFGIRVPGGLPAEFEQYLRGSLAWYAGDSNGARVHWEALLQLPSVERHFRSVRAAYMLGRSWENENPTMATEYYEKARRLAAVGFADSFGQASASLGWEARLVLRKGDFARATDMYLDHMAAGDDTAVNSLRFVAIRALDDEGDGLTALAANARTRHVISSYLVSQHGNYEFSEASISNRIDRWLVAMEAAGVQDDESAAKAALAAYDTGQWEIAQRWINRARATPVTQWLQAKLLLRAGKLDDAAELLAAVAPLFPTEPPDTNNPAGLEFKDSLFMGGFNYATNRPPAASQLLGELGVLRLTRREYTEALDALLRSGFWMDASYVAERVLTADELRAYVDRQWPPAKSETNSTENVYYKSPIEIRYLLARRLARLERFADAREYFPAKLQADFDSLVQNLKSGRDESLPPEQRAHALFEAAKTTRTNGMEFLGTEVEPDWFIESGYFTEVPLATTRTNGSSALTPGSEDELARARQNDPEPNERFHYRYQAAALGWEAAKLMPNNSDETARVLCTAGSWLKSLDSGKADVFYKALVRRCRKTSIGDQADRMRWFPLLDEQGNVVPWKPQPLECSEWTLTRTDTEPPQGGYFYVITKGNSWRDVAEDVQKNHNVTVTAQALRQANPEITSSYLSIGAKIFVPAPPPGTAGTPIRE